MPAFCAHLVPRGCRLLSFRTSCPVRPVGCASLFAPPFSVSAMRLRGSLVPFLLLHHLSAERVRFDAFQSSFFSRSRFTIVCKLLRSSPTGSSALFILYVLSAYGLRPWQYRHLLDSARPVLARNAGNTPCPDITCVVRNDGAPHCRVRHLSMCGGSAAFLPYLSPLHPVLPFVQR